MIDHDGTLMPLKKDDLEPGKTLPVLVDGYPGTALLYHCTWSIRIRLEFDPPHPRWRDCFQTKYFFMPGPGQLQCRGQQPMEIWRIAPHSEAVN